MTPVPLTLRTARLLLRPWTRSDAAALLPILEANVAHLSPWIPAHVWTPVPLPQLESRLDGFASDFADNRSWRYAMLSPEGTLLGETAMFPRDASRRVPYADADRVEIGYWLDQAATGQGYALEAARAALHVAEELPQVACVEIHCDAANAPSNRIPRSLGFALATDGADSVWRKSRPR